VIPSGELGIIHADCGYYIGVVLDSDPKKRIRNYHPTCEMEYDEMVKKPPLKSWRVLLRGWGWWDPDECTASVYAATAASQARPGQARPGQAKDRAYNQCEMHDIECIFGLRSAWQNALVLPVSIPLSPPIQTDRFA